ncbi:MAG: 1-acyl-sn-glycerol-3-phosphate acyltransferase [Phormidium tanganyikae FI6-MK23]|jgi:1-acyl-sn-glycerol-3-phosphate acyltransferase|nr:1-acyl-sn-glycerol-3-phosphate acyltransferase [Phormidium tanganyikae FI6-MK23]
MPGLSPLQVSQLMLMSVGTRMYSYHCDRVPKNCAVLVVSNHRSVMDAMLLMSAIDRPIRFACHHYMGQVPVMREIVTQLGCFPLDSDKNRQSSFFHQAIELLKSRQAVGVFPEGTLSMVQPPQPNHMGEFHRGFAHLVLRAPIDELAILPVAISPQRETINPAIPLKVLSFFDPAEPLFDQEGWHPLVLYQDVNILIGHPIWITSAQRADYQGKYAKKAVVELVDRAQTEIKTLLHQGYF